MLLDMSSFLEHSPQLYLTVIEGSRVLLEVDLLSFGKQYVSFGASTQNDICFASSYGIVSSLHGSFLLQGGMCYIQDNGSTNGIYVNGIKTTATPFAPGDVAIIGNIASRHYDSVMLMLSYEEATWRAVDLNSYNALSIGRAASNDLVLGTPSVSARHAALMRLDAQTWQVTDLNSFNGTYVAGSLLQGSRVLQRGDVIQIANATAVYTGDALVCGCANAGVEVEARDLVQIRRVRGGSRTTTDHVSLRIKRGEFVAILGGSGAGKSTLLNELNGTDPAVSGSVRVNGVDLYRNYGILKNGIGYVPQQDIVYDDLRLIDMLRYAADLRMTPDSTPQEREQRCYDILAQLELAPFADQYIRSLSGGQRKRASIAVEMLADPRLFFLDEPTSGLDPGIEKSLIKSCRRLLAVVEPSWSSRIPRRASTCAIASSLWAREACCALRDRPARPARFLASMTLPMCLGSSPKIPWAGQTTLRAAVRIAAEGRGRSAHRLPIRLRSRAVRPRLPRRRSRSHAAMLVWS